MTNHVRKTASRGPTLPTDAQLREAEMLVAPALLSEFPIEPLIGNGLSWAFSLVQSTIRRHGLLLQKALADVLEETGRFYVRRDVRFLITGDSAVIAPPCSRVRSQDNEAGRIIEVDVCAFELATATAMLIEFKRGLGPTAVRKRRATCADLEIIANSFASGAVLIDGMAVTGAVGRVVDYYGASGFPARVTLHGGAIDHHFDAPVLQRLDLVTTLVARALQAALPGLFDQPPPQETVEQRLATIERGSLEIIRQTYAEHAASLVVRPQAIES